jgi:hypothetical protein
MYIDEAPFGVAATVDEMLALELVFGCPDACLRPSTELEDWKPLLARTARFRGGARRAVRKAMTAARRIGLWSWEAQIEV